MINWYQASVLADRYLETMLADHTRTLLLCMQAPLGAVLTIAAWYASDQSSEALCLMMVSASFLMGCVNACQALVRERAFFLRERMVNLEVGAYLYSKLRVLGLLGVVQLVLYLAIVYGACEVPVAVGWAFLVAWLTSLCGTSLGLMLSSLFTRSNHVMVMVPLVVLPQTLIGAYLLNGDVSGALQSLFTLMPLRWSYESLQQFTHVDSSQAGALMGFPMLLFFCALFLGVAVPCLKSQRY